MTGTVTSDSPLVGLVLTRGELHCVELVEHPAGSRGVACGCGAAIAWGKDGEPVKCAECGLHHFKTKEV